MEFLKIHFWLCLVFVAACRLPLVAGSGGYSSLRCTGFSCAGKESACNEAELGSIPGLGGSPGEGKGYPLQYPGLENFMDCIVHGVAQSQTRLKQLSSSICTTAFFSIHLPMDI